MMYVVMMLLMCMVSMSHAATFYVKPIGGSDSNPGTQALPWKTFDKVKATLNPGDVANVLGGTYTPSDYQASSGLWVWTASDKLGSSNNPITLRANPGDTVILDGARAGNGFLFDGAVGYGGHYVIIQGFIFQNYAGNAIGGFPSDKPGHHLAIIGNTFRDFGRSSTGAISIGQGDHVIVKGNTFLRIGGAFVGSNPDGSAQHCTYLSENLSYALYEGNKCYQVTGYGLHGWGHGSGGTSHHWIVRFNAHRDARNYNYLIAGTNYDRIYIYNNTSSNTDGAAYPAYDSQRMSGGLRNFANGTTSNIRVVNNIFSGIPAGEQFNSDQGVPWNSYFWDNNDFFKSGSTTPYNINGAKSLATVRSSYGIDNNGISANPSFTNPGVDDYSLAGGSPAIDTGRKLTTATNNGPGTLITVTDAGYFFDGYGMITGDTIKVGSTTALVTSVDAPNNRITIQSSVSWVNNDAVTLAYNGTNPDMGAFESGATVPDPPSVGTFHIATNGSDVNTCTSAKTATNPWTGAKKTFAAAKLCGLGTSTYVFHAGTYTEMVSNVGGIIAGGTDWAHPTTITKYQSDVVTVQFAQAGSAVVTFDDVSNAYTIVDGLIIDAMNTSDRAVAVTNPAHHVRIQNNTLKNSTLSTVLSNGSSNVEILKNTCNGTAQFNCILVEGQATGDIVRGNTIFAYAAAGIDVAANGTIVDKNLVRDPNVGSTEAGIVVDSLVASTVTNNVVVNAYGCIHVYSGSGHKVYNNTCFNNSNHDLKIEPGVTSVDAKGNIFTKAAGIQDAGTGTSFAVNLCSDVETGCALTGSASFVNTATLDFELNTGSIAIDVGQCFPEVVDDFLSRTRPFSTTCDIGAYESRNISAPSQPTTVQAQPFPYVTTGFLGYR